MNKVKIFNIQKFSIHDGPGIRTTIFFKGCPLKCKWCHNPEGIDLDFNITYDVDKCTLCGQCLNYCSTKALTKQYNKIITDFTRCNYCGNCAFYCINDAREIVGKDYTIDELVKESKKDIIFYEESGGGVTLSGGEPLLQIDGVLLLLKKLKQIGIHTAVDTSGYIPYSNIEKTINYTDLFLYDIKAIDDEKHKKYTGVSNKLILENLVKLSNANANINIRMPIIEGINASKDDILKTLEFLKTININKINILPYHDIAKHKYKKLNLEYRDDIMKIPTNEKMNEIKNILEKYGYDVRIGG